MRECQKENTVWYTFFTFLKYVRLLFIVWVGIHIAVEVNTCLGIINIKFKIAVFLWGS